jgi:hypothetical protein
MGCWEDVAEDALVTLTPGLAWVACGQPFDVVRVRLAAQSGRYSGALDCTRRTLATEGVFAFWKGATPALMISMPYSMIMFGIYHALRPRGPRKDGVWYAEVFLAGFIAGVPMTLFQNPLDCWRVRCATAPKEETGLAVLRRVLSSEPPSVFMRGFWLTAVRNMPGGGMYFCSYEWALGLCESRGWLGRGSGGSGDATRSAVVGACTGSLVTLLLHPTEVVRANLQNTSASAGGTLEVMRRLLAGESASGGAAANAAAAAALRRSAARAGSLAGGWRVLYAGWGVATAKALPVNAAGFWCVTSAQGLVESRRKARRRDVAGGGVDWQRQQQGSPIRRRVTTTFS